MRSGSRSIWRASASGFRELPVSYRNYMKVMRFTLVDEKDRTFRVQRWCFRGSIDRWIDLWESGERREALRSGQEVLPAHRAGVVLRVDVIGYVPGHVQALPG